LRGPAFRLLDDIRLHVDGWWREPRGHGRSWFWDALAAEHALQERGGLDQLAGTREAGGFANCVMIEQLITSFYRRERP
jgi:hypothetical protein